MFRQPCWPGGPTDGSRWWSGRFGTPEAWPDGSRWWSEERAEPPERAPANPSAPAGAGEARESKPTPGRGILAPLPGRRSLLWFLSGGSARSSLHHRLPSGHASGVPNLPLTMTIGGDDRQWVGRGTGAVPMQEDEDDGRTGKLLPSDTARRFFAEGWTPNGRENLFSRTANRSAGNGLGKGAGREAARQTNHTTP